MNGRFSDFDKDEFAKELFSGFRLLQNNSSQPSNSNNQVTEPAETSTQQTIASKKKKKNKQASLRHSDVSEINEKVNKIIMQENENAHLNPQEQKIWALINQVNQLASDIQSCDLPSDEESHAVIVKLVQRKANAILNDNNKTWLQKMIEIGIVAKQNLAGNCMEKAIFGFVAMLHHLHTSEWIKEEKISLKLAYFNNHFIVIVADRFFMDPWLNFSFPLPKGKEKKTIEEVFDGFGELRDYLSIDKDGQCFTHELNEYMETALDDNSTKSLSDCLLLLEKNANYFALSVAGKSEAKKPTKRKSDEISIDENKESESLVPSEKNEEDLDSFFDAFEGDFSQTQTPSNLFVANKKMKLEEEKQKAITNPKPKNGIFGKFKF